MNKHAYRTMFYGSTTSSMRHGQLAALYRKLDEEYSRLNMLNGQIDAYYRRMKLLNPRIPSEREERQEIYEHITMLKGHRDHTGEIIDDIKDDIDYIKSR